mgnify:CR=1 FL=1
MSNPQIVSLSAAGTSAGLAVDTSVFTDGIGLVVGFSDGTSGTYTVQCSGDRADVPDADKLWVDLPLLTSKTTALTSNLEYPVTALRLSVASLAGRIQLAVVYAR